MTRPLIERIVANQPGLEGLPVLANVDFGHTNLLATLPIGGAAELVVADSGTLVLTGH
jgi:muramoyltetrapeptide carboxypeptidase LdcA involved in peptidoglycan recycling